MKHSAILKALLPPVLASILILFIGCEHTPEAEKTVLLAPEGVFSAALTEHYALLGTTEGPAQLWQLNPQALLHTWRHTETDNGIVYIAISTDERFAVTAERDSLAWWRIADGALMNVWSLPGIKALKLSSDGLFALIGLNDKAVYFSLDHGKTLYAFKHDDAVLSVALSRNGHYALTGSEDKKAKLWDLTNGTLKYEWLHRNKLATVALSDDERYALTNAALSQTYLWKLSDGKLLEDIGPDLLTLSAARFSPDGNFLVTGRTSQRIDLWAIKTGKSVTYWRPQKEERWRPSAATILDLTFIQNGKKIISITANGFLQRWIR
ncbi:MAG: WD40 repeat domain-containing protein [Gammaproteobacteria bacterium]